MNSILIVIYKHVQIEFVVKIEIKIVVASTSRMRLASQWYAQRSGTSWRPRPFSNKCIFSASAIYSYFAALLQRSSQPQLSWSSPSHTKTHFFLLTFVHTHVFSNLSLLLQSSLIWWIITRPNLGHSLLNSDTSSNITLLLWTEGV